MFFLKRKQNNYRVICDIDSGSVCVSLVLFGSIKPTVLFSFRTPTIASEILNPNNLENRILLFLDESSEKLRKALVEMNKNKTDSIHVTLGHVFLSAPWFVSKNTIAKYESAQPFMVDRHFFNEMIEAEEDKFKKEMLTHPRTSILGDMHIIEREVQRSVLNGYETESFSLKEINGIELSLYMSVASHKFIKAIKTRFERHLNIHHIAVHSFPTAVFKALKTAVPNTHDYIFLNITSEATDLVFTTGGVIQYTTSLAYGKNALVRYVGSKLGMPYDISLSFLRMHEENQLEDRIKENLDNLLKAYLENWWGKISEELKKNIPTIMSGNSIFLSISPDISKMFVDLLKGQFQDNAFVLANVLADNHVKYVNINGNKQDPFVSIEAISINLNREEKWL